MSYKEHVVQQGETLSLIGLRYGIPWQTIRDINMAQRRIQSGNPDILWYNNGIRNADVLLIPVADAPQQTVTPARPTLPSVVQDAIDSIPQVADEIPYPTNQPGYIPDEQFPVITPPVQEVSNASEESSKLPWIMGVMILAFVFRKQIFGGR